ncbi:MAG: gliding motility-associated C-terminal domain-containing protein, partial [Saprospiraceae bacterium]
INCADSADGSIKTTVTGGTQPYKYVWNNGATTANLTDLGPGSYLVTVTDQNGCSTQATATLIAPEPLFFSLQVAPAACGDAFADAAILASGGVGPYTAMVDGNPVSGLTAPVAAGSHILQITDNNGCSADTTLNLSLPPVPTLALPLDTLVQFGESLTIEAQTNLSVWQSLTWQPAAPDSSCRTCLLQTWIPLATQRYSVTIVDTFGCVATASIRVQVSRKPEIYIPNVFSPDGDGINDVFQISVGPSVSEVSVFRIFDRWGEMVYNWDEPIPAQLWPGWDGHNGGRKVELGVYVYYLKIKLIDGNTEVLSGDLTITKR